MTIVETTCSVTAGVDTHADVHVAAVVDHLGGVLGIEAFDTTAAGCRRLVDWLCCYGEIILVGVEGTGSYGAGLTRHLTRAGIAVVEIDRPNRQLRRREGKSDPVDAVAAARAALSGQGLSRPRSRDGDVEAIRVLQVACRSAASERIATLHLEEGDILRGRFEESRLADQRQRRRNIGLTSTTNMAGAARDHRDRAGVSESRRVALCIGIVGHGAWAARGHSAPCRDAETAQTSTLENAPVAERFGGVPVGLA